MPKKEKVDEVTPEAETQTTDETGEELAQLRTQLQSSEERVKNEQRISSQKEVELQTLKSQISDRNADQQFQRAMLGALAEQKGVTEEYAEDAVRSRTPDFLKQYDDVMKRQDERKQLEEAKQKGVVYQQKVEALGLTPKNKSYREIYNYVRDGNFEFADAVIAELEDAKSAKPAEPEMDKKAEQKEKDLAMIKELEGRGFNLATDVGGPSSAPSNNKEIIQAYGEGRVSRERYVQACKDLGFEP